MAGTPQDTPEDAHTDLMALIKAGRDMSPDMDQALAESFMEKHKLANQPPPQQPVVTQNGQRTPDAFTTVGGSAISVLVIAAYIVAVIVSQGHLWWLLFPLMAFGFGGWRGYGRYHDERYRLRDERRMARDQWRHERYMARMGYPPDQPEPEQLPEPASKWTPSTPPASSSTPTTGNAAPPANPAG
ncbi:MAG TPA: hypothetical protein VGP82_14030 [Ktedonobacterales bacterium]|jgi:hypothetical protein|nr:hypothetical protein [Ktedonobacterales bacterium]